MPALIALTASYRWNGLEVGKARSSKSAPVYVGN